MSAIESSIQQLPEVTFETRRKKMNTLHNKKISYKRYGLQDDFIKYDFP